MRIGKEGYDVPDHNPRQEEQVKLQDEVELWWNNLEQGIKEEYMEEYYPDKSHLHDADELFEGLNWKQKFELYQDKNPELTMSPDDYPH